MENNLLDIEDYVCLALLAQISDMDSERASYIFEEDVDKSGVILEFIISLEKSDIETVKSLIDAVEITRQICMARIDSIMDKLKGIREAE